MKQKLTESTGLRRTTYLMTARNTGRDQKKTLGARYILLRTALSDLLLPDGLPANISFNIDS